MTVSCQIIEDLLPLYSDGVCSVESKRVVDEHLEQCKHCRELATRAQEEPIQAFEPEKAEADIVVKKGLKKIKLRWRITILVILALIPVAFLLWNEYSGRGIAFTNQKELATADRFMRCLAEGDYESAFSCWDVEYTREQWLENWFTEEELLNLEQDGREKFCALGREVEALGGIESVEYIGTEASYGVGPDGVKSHYVVYKINFGGKAMHLTLSVSRNGIGGFSAGGKIMEPLERLGKWTEWLWQDYKGCYWDPEQKIYVYYETE